MLNLNYHDILNVFNMAANADRLSESDIETLSKLFSYSNIKQQSEINEIYGEVVEIIKYEEGRKANVR